MNFKKCRACGATVPEGKYCDQCGVELLECVNCHTLGTDPFCAECGKPMIARKPGGTTSGGDTKEDVEKTIALKARSGGLILKLEPEAIIGRQDSPYASLLPPLTLFSGPHGKVVNRRAR